MKGGGKVSRESNVKVHYDQVPDEKIIEKYDAEARYRKFQQGTFWARVVAAIAIAFSLFQLYIAGFGALEAIKQRALHLGFVTILIFLLYPGRKDARWDRPTVIDITLASGSLAVALYLVFRYTSFAISGGFANNVDYVFGALAVLLTLEAGRRCIGKELTILASLFLLYSYFGNLIPGSFGHQGYSITRIIEHMYLSTNGIYGIALGVSTAYIFLFILFGAFLGETGMATFINEMSLALAGRSPGGPAKVAIFASGLMGTINGSAVANVATTGAFTIPLMKQTGYKPHFAGAVEAVASTGGQVMPPIMGAAAFLMAEILEIPYGRIMLAAVLPALLYYLAAFTMVHIEAIKLGLKGLPADQLPSARKAFRERGHLVIPLIVIIWLLVKGVTPTYAAFYGIIATIITSLLRPATRLSVRGLLRALEAGARGAMGVAIACAVVGLIIGTTSLTSLGMVLGDNIVALAGGSQLVTLMLTMVTCIILGMGMPTTAVYIVAATMAAPALVKINVDPLAAHLFVFYFGNISNVTPPVALAAFTGAGIAGADPTKVGWTAARLAIAGFIIPYMWVYSPALIAQGEPLHILTSAVTAIIGVIALGMAAQNYFLRKTTKLERLLLLGAALMLIKPGVVTDAGGLGMFAIVYLIQKLQLRQENVVSKSSF
ncbi:MAG: TRAP transporter permease [Thermoanaerobacteraceae bacterium]|nr:TRAP transporter permease [Thermoanaerobacteraceae bacterium]